MGEYTCSSSQGITNILNGLQTNLNSPYVRQMLLKQADDEYDNGNIELSTYYQTQALALGYRCKYYSLKKIDPLEATYTVNPPPKQNGKRSVKSKSSLLNFARDHLKEKQQQQQQQDPNQNLQPTFHSNPQQGIELIRQFCQTLPREWSLLQVCKGFDENTSLSRNAAIISAAQPIYLTLFKNLQMDVYSEPISIKIDMTTDRGRQLFETMYKITSELNEFRRNFDVLKYAEGQKNAFHDNLSALDADIKNAIDSLSELFGPWRYLLSGTAIPHHQEEEKRIYRQVQLFCEQYELTGRQQVLLGSLARFRAKLSKEEIKMAVPEITTDVRLAKRITKFLEEKNSAKAPSALKCYPCILIVDELLDHFFWETLNERQEICRVSSLHSFQALYTKYADQIHDGYLKISVERGSWILNPDKNLDSMEKRLSLFIDFWNPKVTEMNVDRDIPTIDRMKKYLKESDIFIYSGHGSGLQYYSGHEVTNLVSNSVVFLLGCDSTRLRSDGWHGEMNASHLYFFAAKCPAVVGTILIAFDRRLDTWSTNLLSTWIPTKNKTHWRCVDRTQWIKNFEISAKRSMSRTDLYEPRLCWIMCKLRESAETYHSRVCCVYRGLPMWNVKAE